MMLIIALIILWLTDSILIVNEEAVWVAMGAVFLLWIFRNVLEDDL